MKAYHWDWKKKRGKYKNYTNKVIKNLNFEEWKNISTQDDENNIGKFGIAKVQTHYFLHFTP